MAEVHDFAVGVEVVGACSDARTVVVMEVEASLGCLVTSSGVEGEVVAPSPVLWAYDEANHLCNLNAVSECSLFEECLDNHFLEGVGVGEEANFPFEGTY